MKLRFLFLAVFPVAFLPAQQASPSAEVTKYHELLRKRPQAGTIFERFQDAWLAEGTREGLREFLQTKSGVVGATAADHQLLALFLARQGEDAAAVTELDAALKLNATNADAWMEKARAQTRLLDFDKALASLAEAANTAKDENMRVEVARLQGRALLRLGRNDEALKVWQQLAASRPEDLDLAEEVVELMADEGLYVEAAAQADALVKKTTTATDLMTRRLRLGDLLLRADKRDDALAMFESVLEQSGQDTWVEGDVLTRIAQPFRREDDIEGLKRRLEKLHAAYPQRPAVTMELAQVLADFGEKDPAVKLVADLLSRTPGRRDLQERFVSMLERVERFEEAAAQMKRLVEQNTEDKELLIRLATLQEKLKDTKAAQATLDLYLQKAAVKNAPAPEHDHLRVARLFESWEMREAASGAYAALVAAHPDSVSAKEALAHFYHRTEAHEKALEIWRALTKTGGLEDVLRVGQALTSHGRQAEALELLRTRLDEFAKQQRFLAQLSQLATAVKDHANAMLWARQRLTLLTDHAAVQEAVRMAQLTIEDAEAVSSVTGELQKKAEAISIPERCLLAALLEDEDQTEAAEKVLQVPSAAPADQLMLGGQRARLLETRQEWARAAEVIGGMMKLPGGQTSEHARRLVSLHRRALANDKALAVIPEWKKLSPGAVQPWLEESTIELEQGKESASLDVLRQASRKFADDRQVLATLADALARAGRTEEARQAYVSLYEQTEDIQARLRLLAPLAEMSRSEGRLDSLLEDFQTRQRQNRGSAAPWMALAEIHRATNNDEERRRCLYEASRLRPKDLALLTEIARCEEDSGLTKEALRTLDAAAALDKTNATRQKIAQLMIESGDDEAGYRLLFELAGGAQADARALEKMADTMCEHGDWARAIRFLEPLLPNFPGDYRLRYLHATALEEEGREQEAAAAFIELLGIHVEMPEVSALQSQQMLHGNAVNMGSFSVGESYQLPEGAAEWMAIPSVAGMSYEHRQKQSNLGAGWSGSGFYSSGSAVFFNQPGVGTPAPALPRGWVTQPTNVTLLSAMAVYHLIELGQGMTGPGKEALASRMNAAGIRDAALILEVPMYQGGFGIPTELLDQHPNHAALHAVWLVSGSFYAAPEEDSIVVLRRCMTLFKDTRPLLAWQAGTRALMLGTPEGLEVGREAIALVKNFAEVDSNTVNSLTALLAYATRDPSYGFQSSVELPTDMLDTLFELGQRWNEHAYEQAMLKQAHWSGQAFIYALAASGRWDQLAAELERENKRGLDLEKKQKTRLPAQSRRFVNGSPMRLAPQPLQPAWSDLDVSASMATITTALRRANNGRIDYDGPDDATTADEEDVRNGLERVLAGLKTPGLKLMLHIRLDHHAEVEKAVAELLSAPDLRADHWLLAAWTAQNARDWPRVVQCLQKAAAFGGPADGDNAVIFAAQQADAGERVEMRVPLQAVFARLNRPNMQQYEFQQLISVMRATGFEKEAEELQAREAAKLTRQLSSSALAAVNPYSRNSSRNSGNGSLGPVAEKLLAAGQLDAAWPEVLRSLRPYARQWLDTHQWGNVRYTLRQIIERLERQKAAVGFAKWLAGHQAAGWREMIEDAALLELLDKHDEAGGRYETVIKQQPRAWQAHVRAAALLADSDPSAAAKLLMPIPPNELARYFYRLAQECSRSDDHSTFEHRLALIRMLTAWLDAQTTEKRRLDPALAAMLLNMPQNLQQSEYRDPIRFEALYSTTTEQQKPNEASVKARQQLREAHDAFCTAMLRLPMIAEGGFAPLAGLALRDKSPLENLELQAREVLAAKSWIQRAAPSMMYWNGNSNSRYGAQNQIAMPHPEDILVLAAAQRGEFEKIEKEIAPLIEQAKGRAAGRQALAYEELFRADNATFTAAAEKWMKSMSPRPDPGAGAEVVRLWSERKLSAPIHDFFFARLKTQRGSMNTEEISRYILTLESSGNAKEAAAFIRRVRDLWFGASREKFRAALQAYVKQRQQSRGGIYFSSGGSSQSFNSYLQLHQSLLQTGRGSTASLTVLMEDGMLDEQMIVEQIGYYVMPEGVFKGPTERLLGCMTVLHMLDDAPTFRAWFNDSSRSYSILSRLLDQLDNSDMKDALAGLKKALEARKPATFGSQLVLALMDGDSGKRAVGLNAFLTARGAELPKLTPRAREELHALLHKRINDYPGSLTDAQRKQLTPLFEAEAASLMETGEKILAATQWANVGMEEYSARTAIPRMLASLARRDRAKAVQILEKTVTLLKGTPNHLQNIANGHSGVFEMLSEMGRAPQLMKETIEIAEREKAPARWTQGYSYSLEKDRALRDTDHVLAIFTDTPFVADAADFRCVPLSGRSEATVLNLTAQYLRSGSYKTAHDALEVALKSRQPQTFGVKTTLLLMAGSNIQIDAYVRENSADFARLRPEEADGLMRTLESRSSKYREPEKLPEDVRRALQPLLVAREKQQDELVSRILGAQTLQSVNLSANDNEMLSSILRRLGKANTDKASQLFEKITLLFMAETRRQNGGNQIEDTPLAYWLRESSGVAPFFSLSMKRAELEGIGNSDNWLRGVESEIQQNNQLRDPDYVTTLLAGSAFLEEAERFQAWPVHGTQDGSLLNLIIRHAKGQEPVKKAVREQLAKLKPTFGVQLILACLNDEPEKALRGLVTKNGTQIASLGNASLAGFSVVMEKWFQPLARQARDMPALAAVLAFEKKRASDTADAYLSAHDYNTLYRVSGGSDAHTRDTAFIASFDTARGLEVARHLLKLMEVEDARNRSNQPEYTNAARFLQDLGTEPALWSFMSTEAVKRKLDTNDNWRRNAFFSVYLNNHEKNEAFVIDLFERSGFFGSAETYNPLPGLGGKQSVSALEEFILSVRRDQIRTPLRGMLRKHIDAQKTRTFGMDLVRCLMDDNGDEAVKKFAAVHGADLLKLPKETVPIIADLLASRTDELIEYPVPLRDSIKQKANGFRDQVLAGKPFEEFKMDQKSFEREFTKVLGTTYMRNADFTGGATFFDKALRIMEERETRAGWGNGISNGWTLRSNTLGDFLNGKPANVFCFAMQLYHEDDSGLLAHNGWHTADGCGPWMRGRWEFWGGRASATEGMKGLVDELARYLKPAHATLLGLPFHNLFTRLPTSDVGAITLWAEREKGSDARAAILREIAIAGRLYLTACAEGRGSNGTCEIGSTPVIDLLMKHYRASILNEKINPRVRIALAHHLCNVCPFAVPDDLVKKAAQLAAQENKALHAIHGFQLAHILRRFVGLPVDDEWKRIAQEFWDGWARRQSFAKEKRERGRYYGTLDTPTFAMVQLAARARNERWLTQLLEKDAPRLKTLRTTVMLIATSGWEERAATFLAKEGANLHGWESAVVKWEPGFEKHAAALAKACKDPGLGLFGELIVAEAQDFPMPMVRAFKEPGTFEQRITALAPRVENTVFTDEKIHVVAATIVSNYAPRAAVQHLSAFLDEAAKKIDVAAFAMIRDSAVRAEAAYVLSAPMVKGILAGDTKPWNTAFETLDGMTGDDLYLRNYARNRLADTLADSISLHWQAGTKRDVGFWKEIFMQFINDGENHSDDCTGQFVSLLMPLLAASGDAALAEWRKSLERPQLSTLIEALGQKDEIWRNAGRLAGDESLQTRLPLAARLKITTHLLADDVVSARNVPTLFTRIRDENLLSDKEIAENAEVLFTALAKKNNHALKLAELAVERGKFDIASRVLDAALEAKPAPTVDLAFDLLEMRFGLEVRVGRKAEAATVLARLEAHEKAPSNKFTLPILKRLQEQMK